MNKLICGAKSRNNQGLPCRLKPLNNGRCRFHGGKTPIKHGRYTKAIMHERKILKKVIQISRQNIKNMMVNLAKDLKIL